MLTEGVCGMTCCNRYLPAKRDQPSSPTVIARRAQSDVAIAMTALPGEFVKHF